MTAAVIIAALTLTAALTVALATVARRAREAERKLLAAENAANTDQLTGLANRAGLRRRLINQQSTAEAGEVSALVLLDLDGLKSINDRHGHDVGDAVLAEVARRIARPRARVVCSARLGGDDFAILLGPHPNPTRASQDAEQVAYGVCASIAEPLSVEDVAITITASAGVAALPSAQIDRLLSAADMAMYRAKTKGLGICRYQPLVDGPADPRHRPRVRLRDLRNHDMAGENDTRWTMTPATTEWFETPEVS